ncbi:MAG: ABC-2 type transport system ATP-binding protein [Paraglaciecola sp.]|jgi:ABC-2 type transport system ATP-binding protein|uniref:ABC transporter ATP-binding protein n=1 Tax=uncultured Paraglaciecola sp. TaxID=1765024 RepID=UPI0025F021B5|nr:ABC transporter ATP-binding protein [uncultured Paraglaciecola sp.]
MLAVKELSKSYAAEPALSNVSFSLNRGEVVALLGANGSGKTTTVQSICRLIEWDQGEIFIDNIDTRTSTSFLKQIGAVLGGCRNTNWRLTAKQNADYFARLRGFSGSSIRKNIEKLHTALGLDEHAKKEVMKLSTGNKQKAALLCALSYSPDFVLLDEPTLGLDFNTVNDLQRIIKDRVEVAEQGFLVTSHDLGFIDKICDRVVVLDHGKLLFEGSLDTLKARLFKYELTIELKQPIELSILNNLWAGRFDLQLDQQTIKVNYGSPEQSLVMLHYLHEHNIQPLQLQIDSLSMEKAYQTLVQQKDVK